MLLGAGDDPVPAACPTLRLESRTPLVVRGEQFRAGEIVRLTALTGLGPVTTTVGVHDGRFRATIPVRREGCGAVWAVRASGDRGSVAYLPLGEAPVSVPPPLD